MPGGSSNRLTVSTRGNIPARQEHSSEGGCARPPH
jgi:hypothetical protein